MLRKFRTIAIVFTIRILQFRSYNPSFTRLEIWFRFIFLLCTFVATVSLICKMQFTSNFKLSRFFFAVLVLFLHEKVLGRSLVSRTKMDVNFNAATNSLQWYNNTAIRFSETKFNLTCSNLST